MKGRGINNLLEFLDSSPSPQPSPVEGEGVFWTFYEIIIFAARGNLCPSLVFANISVTSVRSP